MKFHPVPMDYAAHPDLAAGPFRPLKRRRNICSYAFVIREYGHKCYSTEFRNVKLFVKDSRGRAGVGTNVHNRLAHLRVSILTCC